MKRSLLLAASLVLAASASARAEDDNPLLKRIKEKVGSGDKPFTLMVHIKVKEGSEKKFEELAARAEKGTREEKGNVAYQFHRDTDKPNDYVLFERWKNLAALREHFGKDYVKEFLTRVPELAEGQPRIQVLTPVGGE